MRPWLKPCLVVYWLSLTTWFAALVSAGLAAAHMFGTLPQMNLVLERFTAYPTEGHGMIAAGQVMAGLFFSVDLVQFLVVPVAVMTLALQLTLFGMAWQRPSNLVRGASVGLAAGLFAWYAWALAPDLNANLRAYWQAAEAGDLDTAMLHEKTFIVQHGIARLVLEANLALVLIALGASAVALGPPGDRP